MERVKVVAIEDEPRKEGVTRYEDPGWVRWWRQNPEGKPVPPIQTKAARKRARKAGRR